MKWKFYLLAVPLLLAACQTAPQPTELAAPDVLPPSSDVSPQITLSSDAACDGDGKQACPLVKPVKNMTAEYVRTPEQTALMEAFDRLSLEEKFIALESGTVVCTEFIHDTKWEHKISSHFIEFVGQEAVQIWEEGEAGCHSIYDFAGEFGLTYEDLEKLILENQLEQEYPLEDLKAGMEKWIGE